MGIKKEHYYRIQRDYDQKQFQVNYERTKRTEEVCQKFPLLKEIQEELSELQVRKAKNRLLKDSMHSLMLEDRIKSLINERDNLLIQNGYPIDYMLPKYSCTDCQDTGFTQEHEMCHCFRQELITVLYNQSNVRSMLERNNFAHFDASLYDNTSKDVSTGKTARENIQETAEFCKRYIEEFKSRKRNLLFFGNTGVGKTFLTNCIAKELLERSFSVLYLTAIDLSNILADVTFRSASMKEDDKMLSEYIYSCELLIIDDLGTEVSNSIKSSNLYNCLDKRLGSEKSTIISTNLSLSQLNQIYSDRIFSRIIGNYSCFKIYGEDLRRTKRL